MGRVQGEFGSIPNAHTSYTHQRKSLTVVALITPLVHGRIAGLGIAAPNRAEGCGGAVLLGLWGTGAA